MKTAFSVLRPFQVTIQIPVRIDHATGEEILTPEAHRRINNAKKAGNDGRDHQYDDDALTPALAMQWFQEQLERDLSYFRSRLVDVDGWKAKEIWRDSNNPEAVRAKLRISATILRDVIFRYERLLRKKQPWNKALKKAQLTHEKT